MATTTPMIQGREYDFTDIDMHMLGKTVVGFTGIKYQAERDGEVYYGSGPEPQSFTKGKKKYQASAMFQKKELDALQASLPPGKDFSDIAPFDIQVSFGNDGAPTTTDTIHVLMIHGRGQDGKSGGGVMENELKFLVGGITWGSR